MKKILLIFSLIVAAYALQAQPKERMPKYNIEKETVLYTVGYAHLDSQWNWDYPVTINQYIKRTLTDNFELFEKYPDYVFSFTGSRRYKMMKEYYPDLYQRMIGYMHAGRWFPTGSCVDEGEVNVSSSESLLRQVLYGNDYYQKEFGMTSCDYMLPDCFGFPATMPSILSHAGLKGFSTQKLSWKSAVGIPFNVGVWEGPDGKGVVSALNATDYGGRIPERLDRDSAWVARMDENLKTHNIKFDFRYYGVGDIGGAPRTKDVENVVGSLRNKDSKIKVVLSSSDQMFKDISPALKAKLPRYSGDLLLIEHSAGSLTSQSFMKRSNRKNEVLAKATEQSAIFADWSGRAAYPFGKINSAWNLILGSQMHDILPGTSIPEAYEYSWNDEFVAMNNLSTVMKNSIGALVSSMDTQTDGVAVAIYNPVAAARQDVAIATMNTSVDVKSVVVKDSKGVIVPSQIISRNGEQIKIAFVCSVPSMSVSIYDVLMSQSPASKRTGLTVSERHLENEFYRVSIAPNGDIESVYDKGAKKEMLSAPATLQFLRESPNEWPAWNMDWADRQQPHKSLMDKNVTIRVVEDGDARVALEVSRQGENSRIVQHISLAYGESGRRVEVANRIDWQSRGVSLKAAFPMSVSNPMATYSLSTAAIERGNNEERKFEVPSREWLDLTDTSGEYGVSILEDCRYGSDKPSDNTLRLTMMYTPEANWDNFSYQATQDWGIHDVTYALYGHLGSWSNGTPWQAKFLNQPLIAFEMDKHRGDMGRELSIASTTSPQVDVMALKKMENGDYYIVRLNELYGDECRGVSVKFFGAIKEAFEVDGQEKRIGNATIKNGELVTDMGKFGIRSFAVRFEGNSGKQPLQQAMLDLNYNTDIISMDSNREDGSIGGSKLTLPAEMLPDEVVSEDVRFAIRGKADGMNNAVECVGQKISLPEGRYNRAYILATAQDAACGVFDVDGTRHEIEIAKWRGFIGQHYAQVVVADSVRYKTLAINNPYLRKDNVAWYSSHYHTPKMNMAYKYCYLYKYEIEIEAGAKVLTLPNNPYIKVLSITVAENQNDNARNLIPLHDEFSDYPTFHMRNQPPTRTGHK